MQEVKYYLKHQPEVLPVMQQIGMLNLHINDIIAQPNTINEDHDG